MIEEKLKYINSFEDGLNFSDIFQTVNCLGKGSEGKVLLCYNKKSKKKVAVKVLRKETVEEVENFFTEHFQKVNQNFSSSKFILPYHSIFIEKIKEEEEEEDDEEVEEESEGDNYYYQVYTEMELMDSTLQSFLLARKCDKFYLSTEEFLTISLQIAEGVKTMHEKGYVHRDLKAENVLIRKDPSFGEKGISAALADLTLMGKISKGKKFHEIKSIVGTPSTMSPEVLNDLIYGYKSDVFSLGCILYFLLTLSPILPPLSCKYRSEGNPKKTVSKIKTNLENRNIPKPIIKLVSRMLKKDFEKRPKIKHVVEDLQSISLGKPKINLFQLPKATFKKLKKILTRDLELIVQVDDEEIEFFEKRVNVGAQVYNEENKKFENKIILIEENRRRLIIKNLNGEWEGKIDLFRIKKVTIPECVNYKGDEKDFIKNVNQNQRYLFITMKGMNDKVLEIGDLSVRKKLLLLFEHMKINILKSNRIIMNFNKDDETDSDEEDYDEDDEDDDEEDDEEENKEVKEEIKKEIEIQEEVGQEWNIVTLNEPKIRKSKKITIENNDSVSLFQFNDQDPYQGQKVRKNPKKLPVGDSLKLNNSTELSQLFDNNCEFKLIYSGVIQMFDQFTNTFKEFLLLVTPLSIYFVQKNDDKTFKIERKIEMGDIENIFVSSLSDDFIVIHILQDEGQIDCIFNSPDKTEIINTITDLSEGKIITNVCDIVFIKKTQKSDCRKKSILFKNSKFGDKLDFKINKEEQTGMISILTNVSIKRKRKKMNEKKKIDFNLLTKAEIFKYFEQHPNGTLQ